MNIEQARAILANEDADSAVGLEAAAALLRFHGIADPRYLGIAEIVEAVLADLPQQKDQP